jgi:hypothetical protein
LLDDFYHLDYLMRAFNGVPEVLLKLLWSNWSPDTTLTSYRPLVSFSLAADFALWNINPVGYHATNLLMFGGCIALVSLIANELCGVFEIGNARWVAVATAFLFAAYPLHTEAVGWIIGRVDVLCGLFLFASTYCYLLQRRTGRRGFLVGSVATFILAMMTKEMAVTLPLILTLLEWLAPTPPSGGRIGLRLSRPVLWMWGTLAVFAIWRTAILGTVVGGYGGTGWKTVKQGLKNFADNATLLKLFFGASEEFPIEPWTRNALWGSILAIDISGIALLKLKRNVWRLYLFLLAWTACTVLPTFQIWHIWPNLVGSRLFFLGSAPLCIALAMIGVGTIGSARSDRMRVIAGAIACVVITLTWTVLLQTNLQAWNGAARQLQDLRTKLQTFFDKNSSEKDTIFIPILPQDYKGAPILGRPEYLYVLMKPPFSKGDYTDRILTAEPIIAGGNEVVGPAVYAAASRHAREVLLFDPKDPLLARITDKESRAPLIAISPQNPLTLRERADWLRHPRDIRPILTYDCSTVPGAVSARMYIGKPWQPFTNALRAVPFEKQFLEREVGPLPPRSTALLPAVTPGVHDIAVLAFDKDDKPVGMMSETVSVNSRP